MTEQVSVRNTRTEILQAAHGLFTENGFHGTSMRRIADKAGVALGGIYNHFSGKEEIFVTIFMEMHPYREMVRRMTLAVGEDIESTLHDTARRFEDGLVDRPDQFLSLMFIELVEFKGKHIKDFFHEIFPQLFAAGQRYFADQEKLRDIPPLMMLRILLGLFFSYFMVDWIFGDNLPLEARQNGLDYLVDIYLHGIVKPGLAE